MTSRGFRFLPLALALTGLPLTAVLVGCKEQPAARNTGETKTAAMQPISELAIALDALRDLNAPNSQEAGTRSVFYLNQWISRQDIDKNWAPDPMLKTLASALQPAVEMAALERLSFSESDVAYLQQCQWLGDIAERTRREPTPEPLQSWLKELGKSTSPQQAEQLAAAERLFDWTIRNVQLDELPPPPKAPTASVGGDPAANSPPLRGEVGPGYGRVPWQTLLYGHGDKLERSRIFLLLARQVGVEGAILAIADPQSAGSSNPWCCALLIGDELYLFDAELGLPIPGADRQGIATLQQVIENPELLRQLDVPDGPKYKIEAADLKRIVALIDAEPLALSHRMQVLQAGVPKSRHIVVNVVPSTLQSRLRKHGQIGQVSLWRIPFEAALYQIGMQQRLSQDPAAYRDWYREHGMLAGQHPLLRARDLHFQGKFTDEGARSLYLEVRQPSEKEIDLLGTSSRMRERIGLNTSLPEDPAQRSEMLENIIGVARRGKQNATYWLGLTFYEQGNYPVAKDWLLNRTLSVKPKSPWTVGARYNLARTHEKLGEFDEARKLYEADDSPQRHGNLLRARWLAERENANESATKPESADAKPTKDENGDVKPAEEENSSKEEDSKASDSPSDPKS